jgi:hypothetical protein
MGKRYAASLQQKELSLSMSVLMGFRSVFAATEICSYRKLQLLPIITRLVGDNEVLRPLLNVT